jgi:hypothetical protein
MIKSLLSSLASVAHVRSRDDRSATSRYFNRPKFLVAPDPSMLAEPEQFFAQKRVERNHGAFGARLGASKFHPLSTRPPPLNNQCYPAQNTNHSEVEWSRDPVRERDLPTDSMLVRAPQHNSVFPHPPTLVDILRMEPQLSLADARKRASDVVSLRSSPDDDSNPKESPFYLAESSPSESPDSVEFIMGSPYKNAHETYYPPPSLREPDWNYYRHEEECNSQLAMPNYPEPKASYYAITDEYDAQPDLFYFHYDEDDDAPPKGLVLNNRQRLMDTPLTSEEEGEYMALAAWITDRLFDYLTCYHYTDFRAPGYVCFRLI